MKFACHPFKLETLSLDERLKALKAEIKFYEEVADDTVDVLVYSLAKDSLNEMKRIHRSVTECMQKLQLRNLKGFGCLVLKNEGLGPKKHYV